MEKLREQYKNEVIPALMKKFNYKSVMEVPKLEKIVLNVGLGDIRENPKALENTINDLSIITGQKPVVTKARKSIAAFKIREGVNMGCKVTLRSEKMYEFAYKFFNSFFLLSLFIDFALRFCIFKFQTCKFLTFLGKFRLQIVIRFQQTFSRTKLTKFIGAF